MEPPQVVRVLKRDTFGRVELLDGARGLMVRRVACGSRMPGSRWIARFLARRERRALTALENLPGVAPLVVDADYRSAAGGGFSRPASGDVHLRGYIHGEPLHEAGALPLDFFERLEDLVRELHVRGVCHNDLHKEPNVLVQADGRPALVDFQLASLHPRGGRTFESRIAEDLRHVEKHARRYTHQGGARPVGAPRSRSRLAALWKALGKPVYNFVTRRLLHWQDGEGRRAKEGPWPVRTPAVGPER